MSIIANIESLKGQTRWARNRVLRAESELKESIEDLEKLEKMLELELEKYNNADLSQEKQAEAESKGYEGLSDE